MQTDRGHLFSYKLFCLRYIFHLEPGRYIAVVSAAPKKPVKPEEVDDYDPTEFMIRCVGDNIKVKHLS